MTQAIIALAGNPNVGKSTVFNALTGARQHVGNWPGKTVEKKEGTWTYRGKSYTVVDLPGTYSLAAYSMEEIIARDFIIDARPDAVVVVVDAANLERNLYLVLQIIEMGVPVVVALNMTDIATTKGLRINTEKLAQGLGIAVVPMVAREEEGIDTLGDAIVAALDTKQEILQ
ncbi:MAG: 50S ribosome-binding GTPase [Anaerolineae bacterium]|nr:50S ribosome-binding GTPase [Anaerolineae bacterium]